MELCIRIQNPSVWAIKGKSSGFLVDAEDDEGNPTVKDAEWVTTYELPPMVLVKETLNEDLSVKTPAVIAQQKHVNIDIWGEPALTTFGAFVDGDGVQKLGFYEDAVANGQIAQNNKTETAYRWEGLEVIDPDTINTRTNIWF